MHCFEIMVLQSAISWNNGPFVQEDRLSYLIPDEAKELLDPILDPFGQDPSWYFEKVNFGRPPAPWAFVCLDREYAIAGHVATSRDTDLGIRFATYNPDVPYPMPDDFVPCVGVLVFASKAGLERSVGKSFIFAAAWDALSRCSSDKNWLVILDPLPEEWLAQVLPGDRDLWFASRGR
jgi:hypothetical protein